VQQEAQDGWIEHDGLGCPVAPETLVHVRYRDGEESQSHRCFEAGYKAGFWDDPNPAFSHWVHSGVVPDITDYRVVSA
jgi:hypothetical protein